MARPRALPPGIRPRGRGYVYDWRDASGKTFSRKPGETIAEALAFKARIDAELTAGTFVAGSKTTFAEYAAHWIETHPLKSQTRRGYPSVLRSDLLPYFGSTPLPKITPAMVREWFAAAHVPGRRDNTLRQHVASSRASSSRPAPTGTSRSCRPTSCASRARSATGRAC